MENLREFEGEFEGDFEESLRRDRERLIQIYFINSIKYKNYGNQDNMVWGVGRFSGILLREELTTLSSLKLPVWRM